MSSDFEQAKSRVCQSEGAYVTMRPLVSSWEQRKLGELCELNPTAVLPDSFEYVDLESVAGTDMISHRREEKLTAPSRAQRLASFGDIFYQTVRPYQKNNYFYELPDEDYVFSTGYAQLRPLCDGRFLFSSLQRDQFVSCVLEHCTGTSYPAINANDLAALFLAVPIDAEEQRLVGSILKPIDSLITLHQRKCQYRGLYGCLSWEQRKLGELYEKNDERNAVGFGADRTLSIATMTLNDEGNGAAVESLPNYKVIRIGDVAFEGHTNKEFAYGRFVVNDLIDGIMSPRFTCLRPKHTYPVSFWKYYIHSEQVMRETLVRATKSGTMMNELVPEDLFKQSILVPPADEQELIGSFFSRLDSLITLHQ